MTLLDHDEVEVKGSAPLALWVTCLLGAVVWGLAVVGALCVWRGW